LGEFPTGKNGSPLYDREDKIFINPTLSKETQMEYSKVSWKIREQIRKFSGELSSGICKTGGRFVAEAVYGIQARKSVMLSEIARSLNEDIRLKKTENRLSRQVKREGLGRTVEKNLLSLASRRIKKKTLLVVDLSDISKDHARRMEYMGRVRDGSTGEIKDGYWTLNVIGTEPDSVHITPLINRLYSQEAPDHDSENDEILKAVKTVSRAVENRGIFVIDRGADRRKLLHPLLNGEAKFIIRMVGTRHLVHGGRAVQAEELAAGCRMLYTEQVIREKDGKEVSCQVEYGYRKVKLPGRDEKLTMVVVKGFGEKPMLLLTNVKVRRSRRSCYFIVHSYIKRWNVEETIRCVKQSYDLENIRLLKYKGLQNMMVMSLCAMYFAAVHLGDSIRLGVLAHHALKEAKRFFGIPDFRYYALADGIKALLEGFREPFLPSGQLVIEKSQLPLFDT
jgi:hypothetical protein